MKFNFDYVKDFFDDKGNFNSNKFDKWVRKLDIEDVIITELKGNNKEFIISTKYNAVLPYYKNLSIWLDKYNNTWFTVHTKSETLETDILAFRTNHPNYGIILSDSWLRKGATCLSVRSKVYNCIGECKYFDNVCPYSVCDFGLK